MDQEPVVSLEARTCRRFLCKESEKSSHKHVQSLHDPWQQSLGLAGETYHCLLNTSFFQIVQQSMVQDLYCSWDSVLKALCGSGTVTSEPWVTQHACAWGSRYLPRSLLERLATCVLKPDRHSLRSLKRMRIASDADPDVVLWWLPWFRNLETREIDGHLVAQHPVLSTKKPFQRFGT